MTESHQLPGNGVDQVDRQRVDELLITATQDHQLRSVVARLLEHGDELTSEGLARLNEAAWALDGLDQSVTGECDRLLNLLTSNDVDARIGSDQATDRPLHLISIHVEPDAIDAAVITIEAAGYRRLAPTRRSQWLAFRATRGGCAFVRTDRQPFRVELGWPGSPISAGLLGRLATPHPSDFQVCDLPASLWPGYSLIHLARLPGRLARRRGEPDDLGPFLQTPDDLIAPLLHFADLRSDELLIDLGSGDGRIPIAAAEQFGCRARGIEFDADLVDRAQLAIADSTAADRVQVVLGDAAVAPLDDAGVVIAFLPVQTLQSLVPDILPRLSPGARLVVHEQARLDVSPDPDVQLPLLSAGGVTVAHRWNR